MDSTTKVAVAPLTSRPSTVRLPVKQAAAPAGAAVVVPNLRAQVNVAEAAKVTRDLSDGVTTTDAVTSRKFHCLLYGDPDSRKTSMAARFAEDPADVAIILTRRPEQLLPLKGMGIRFKQCGTVESAKAALLYPEKVFGDVWASRPDRTLILDDISYFKDLVVEDEGIDDGGREIKDVRRLYRGTKEVMWDIICRSVLTKDLNFIAIALANSWMPNKLEERIGPDLPPKVNRLLGADFEYVLYSDKKSGRLWTTEHNTPVKFYNEVAKREDIYWRVTFAKHKLPLSLVGRKVVRPEEDPDLRALWSRIQSGTPAPTAPAGGTTK